MAEILVKATNSSHADPIMDRSGSYKRGYPVVVFPDGNPWGAEERLPRFVVIKIPGIPVGTFSKYINEWRRLNPITGEIEVLQRRRWQIRWADLPQSARNKLASQGELTIRAGGYSGPADYSWSQIKQYFRNLETGLDETEEL